MTKHAPFLPANNAVYPSREPVDQYSTSTRKRPSNFRRCLLRHRNGRKKLLASTPPPPRLVGIELNPGPPKVTVEVKSSSSGIGGRVRQPPSQPQRARTRTRQRRSDAGVTFGVRGSTFRNASFKTQNTAALTRTPDVHDYVNALTHPFTAPQPRLGWGCFGPTKKLTGWYETVAIPVVATDTCFRILFRPTLGSNAIQIVSSNVSSTVMGAAPILTSTSLVNATSLSTLMQSGRIISSELRVKVRCAGTALPGALGGMYLPDETITNMNLSTFAQMTAIQKYFPFSSENAQIGGSVQYRPNDSTSFEFVGQIADTAAIGATTSFPAMMIIGTGWQGATFAVEVAAVVNYEADSGLDSAGQEDYEPSLVTSGTTADRAAEAITLQGPPIVPSISAIEMLDLGLSHAESKSRFSNSLSIAPTRSRR